MSTRNPTLPGYRPGLWLVGLALCFVLGCGGETRVPAPPMQGTLTWEDGRDAGELAGGSVEFAQPNESLVAKAEVLSDGTFFLKEPLPAGKYLVRVAPPAGKPGAKMLGSRFQEFKTSGLTHTASSEPQNVRFKLGQR
jgi:hypothetical protein